MPEIQNGQEWSEQLYYFYGTSFWQHWYILILLLRY